MTRLRRAAIAAGLAAVLALGASGCSPAAVVVDRAHRAAEIAVGQSVTVDLGRVNPSVGDDWVLTVSPDSAVLGHGTTHIDYGEADPPPGSSGEMTVTFRAVGKGSAALSFEYRYRGAVPENSSDRRTQDFTITVR